MKYNMFQNIRRFCWDIKIGRCILLSGGVVVLFMWLLCVPVATWMEAREFNPPENTIIDTVYLVAGARDMERRIEKLIEITAQQKGHMRKILIPDDKQNWKWSKKARRNLNVAEWATERIKDELKKIYGDDTQQPELNIVQGSFVGTDSEMEVLVRFVKGCGDIQNLVIVTSPYHARRAYCRLVTHLSRVGCTTDRIRIFISTAKEHSSDRLPWLTLFELAKLTRDVIGLSRLPIVSRHKIR